jgi:hypothetical protein
MKSLTKNKLILLYVLTQVLLLGACGEKDPNFSLLSDADTFFQSTDKVNSKLDILWVIDNSGSMETSQQNVISNLNSFISDFQMKNLDFKMAVITTDAYRTQFNSNQNCSQFRNRILNSSCNTVSGTTASVGRILDGLTPNLSANFLINASQSSSALNVFGSGDERAFQSISVALNNTLNAGFLRNDSYLSVIIVSDEDDFSHATSQAVEAMGAPYNSNPWAYPGLHAISVYTNYLDTLTGSLPDKRRYNVNAMTILDEPCRLDLSTSFPRKLGTRYMAMANATDGTLASLCGNFAQELELIADNIQTLATQFYLDRIPVPSSIVVKIAGTEIPNRATNPLNNGGWEYDATSNSVRFYGDSYIPAAGAAIKVTYDPAGYGG